MTNDIYYQYWTLAVTDVHIDYAYNMTDLHTKAWKYSVCENWHQVWVLFTYPELQQSRHAFEYNMTLIRLFLNDLYCIECHMLKF
jgi:hypothetical protein